MCEESRDGRGRLLSRPRDYNIRVWAEREGFEPPVPFSTTVFKTVVIDHSTISPWRMHYLLTMHAGHGKRNIHLMIAMLRRRIAVLAFARGKGSCFAEEYFFANTV